MALPIRVGYVTAHSDGGATSTVTLTPDGSIQDGDWMILVMSWIFSGGSTDVALSGWTQIGTKSLTGTMSTCIYKRKRVTGDTNYTVRSVSNAVIYTSSLQWFRDVADDGWVEGSVGTRATSGDTFTTIAPSITTTSTDNLAVSIFTERTLADEFDITSITGASKWYFKNQNGVATNTITVGTSDRVIAGTVPAVSVVYPNTQASNGSAVQIALPSTTSLPAPTAAFTHGGSFLQVSVDGSASVDGNGTITSYSWNFGDGNTASGVTASHTYGIGGTYKYYAYRGRQRRYSKRQHTASYCYRGPEQRSNRSIFAQPNGFTSIRKCRYLHRWGWHNYRLCLEFWRWRNRHGDYSCAYLHDSRNIHNHTYRH